MTLCGGYFHYVGYFWRTGTMIYISLYNNAISSYMNGNTGHKQFYSHILPPTISQVKKQAQRDSLSQPKAQISLVVEPGLWLLSALPCTQQTLIKQPLKMYLHPFQTRVQGRRVHIVGRLELASMQVHISKVCTRAIS